MELIIEEIPKMPSVCLNMIVKNESKIITRLFDSVLSIIDTYCICDTGSDDDTIEIIKNYFTEKNIMGEIIEEPFQNFGYNRTFALQAAKKWADYLLFLDADMILSMHPEFEKKSLIHDTYSIRQGSITLQYYNLRLCKTSLDIKCIGGTHEYYDHNGENHQLKTLIIRDIGDGGCKEDKFIRDIRLLEEDLKKNPKNARTHFYLANSHKNMGHHEKAIELYKKRIEIGGWHEEVWYSYFCIANSYKDMGQMENAVYWWLKAYNFYPKRAESIYEITKYYREISDHTTSYLFYTIGKNIPYPKDDILFMHQDVYSYLFDYEYSILAYYLKNSTEDTRKVFMKLLNIEHALDYNNLISNYKFYSQPIHPFVEKEINLAPLVQSYDINNNYVSSSPSIIPFKNGYLLNIRFVNYHINDNGCYTYHDGYHVQTNNAYMIMDKDFNIKKQGIWENNHMETCRIRGLEDVKLITHNNTTHFVATRESIIKGPDESSRITMVYGKYDLSKNVLEYREIHSPKQQLCEKNWALFTNGKDLSVIYKWYPLTVGTIKDDKLIIEKEIKMPPIFKHMRGSTNGYLYKDELWFIGHVVEYSTPRYYYHCLVTLDAKTLAYKYHSTLFTFNGKKIEYCLGLIVEADRFIMTHSNWDRTSKLSIYDRNKFK